MTCEGRGSCVWWLACGLNSWMVVALMVRFYVNDGEIGEGLLGWK